MIKPKVGEKIYVGSYFYIDRGEDDFCGGLATISEVIESNHLPKYHYNYIMVKLEEAGESRSFNYRALLEKQEELKSEYEGKIAHPCPEGVEVTPPVNVFKDNDFVKGLKEAIETGRDVEYAVDEDFNEYPVEVFDSDVALLYVTEYLEKTLSCQVKKKQ